MAAFVPYDERTSVPQPGAFEFDTLDFKGTIFDGAGRVDHLELAKDIAAFANAQGGVILVGVQEDNRHGYLGVIRGVGDDEAVKKVREAYSKAAADHCVPSPIMNSIVINHPNGRVIAVNVFPSAGGQVVGIRVNKDTWRFPVRISIDTVYLTPEQLPMLMIPELRRKVALLRSIDPRRKRRGSMHFSHMPLNARFSQSLLWHIERTRPSLRRALLGRRPRYPGTPRVPCR